MARSDAHKELFKKINQEWDDYTRSMWDLPGHVVCGRANKIAAMGFCYNQLLGHLYDYSPERVEWLLQYEKPLEAVCSRWTAEQDTDIEAEFERVLLEWGDEEPKPGMNAHGIF